MYTIAATRPHRIRPLARRGRGNQRLDCLYFALPSEQAVNLCSALSGRLPSRPCPGRKASHASSFTPPFLPPQPRLSSADRRRRLQIELFSPLLFSRRFASICQLLSLLLCPVCPLSGSLFFFLGFSACCSAPCGQRRQLLCKIKRTDRRSEPVSRGKRAERPRQRCFTHAPCAADFPQVSVCSETVRLDLNHNLNLSPSLNPNAGLCVLQTQ